MSNPNSSLQAAREATPSQLSPGDCMSRTELADAVNRYLLDTTAKAYDLDRHQIARYERGEVRWPGAPYRAGLRAVLGARSDTDLGFTPRRRSSDRHASDTENSARHAQGWHPDDVVAAAEEVTRRDVTLTRRQALASASAVASSAALTEPLQRWLLPRATAAPNGSTLSEADVTGWEHITREFRNWNNSPTGTLARKAVIAQLNDVSDRLRSAREGPLMQRGFLLGAELAEIAASMSWDLGLHRPAQRYYSLAVRFAKIADDDGFAARTLAAFARQCFDLGKPDAGLELIQLAQYGTRRSAGPALRSMLATREAWAYALRGDVQPFHRAVGLAEDHFAEATVDNRDRWVTGFDRAELYGVIGARYRDLAAHDENQVSRSADYIRRALDLRDPQRGRNRAFDLIGLARTHLVAGEADQAGELITSTLPLAKQWAPGRVGAKLSDFYRECAPFTGVREIDHARTEIRHLIDA